MKPEFLRTCHEVVKWLHSLGLKNVIPVKVTIPVRCNEEEVWEGARYKDINNEDVIYLLGEVPKSYQKRRGICYQIDPDTSDWYVAGGWTPFMCSPFGGCKPEFKDCHPLGHNWMLRRWDHNALQCVIDQYEKKLYHRVGIKVENVRRRQRETRTCPEIPIRDGGG